MSNTKKDQIYPFVLTLYTSNSVISYLISSGSCKEKETDKKQLQEGCTMLKRLRGAVPMMGSALDQARRSSGLSLGPG